MKNRNMIFTAVLSVLACLAVWPAPKAFGVVPPPDGGYPGNNTAEGNNALFNLTTGLYNTALGGLALYSNTGGSGNTATGLSALYHNTTGASNTANGRSALFSNTTGIRNTATGYSALLYNSIGSSNTANGYQALFSNVTGNGNTANGFAALAHSTSGSFNTAIGNGTLPLSEYGGEQNTAIGNNALGSLATGDGNTAIGADAMSNGPTSWGNTAIGVRALQNTHAFGNFGSNNTAVGADALANNTIGYSNIALGWLAGSNIIDQANVICIGAAGENVSNTCYIGNIYGQVSSRGTAVFVNSDGKLGTFSSSRRFKEEIKPMEHASEALFGLKPVTFRYKKAIDSQGIPQFGLVAEDVESVNPDLVVRDTEGKVNTVRYEAINAMLLNEFLKEHRTVQRLKSTVAKQEATIAQQRKDFEANATQQRTQIQALTARLKEQELQIKKVSAQLEVRRPAPQVACVRAIGLREGSNNP
jgi:hypothetical protein